MCTLFPMRSKDAPSLLGSAAMIGAAMRDLMQKRVEQTGVKVVRMELMEVSYAPEIAQSML